MSSSSSPIVCPSPRHGDFPCPPTPEIVADTAGKTVSFGTQTWIIRKIHIHKAAEHTFEENDPLPFECHLLHSLLGDVKARGPKLVIATFFDVPTPTHKPSGKELAAMRSVDRSSRRWEKGQSRIPLGVLEMLRAAGAQEMLPDEGV